MTNDLARAALDRLINKVDDPQPPTVFLEDWLDMRQVFTVDDWNKLYPEGTRVLLRRDTRQVEVTETRSEAFFCNSGYPVIFLVGVRGYYLLDRVIPFPEKEGS